MSNQYTETSYREDPDRREARSEPGYERSYFTDRIESMYKDLKISSTYYKEVLRSLLSSMRVNYLDDQGDYKDVKIHHGRQERIIAKKFQENNLILPETAGADLGLINVPAEENATSQSPCAMAQGLFFKLTLVFRR